MKVWILFFVNIYWLYQTRERETQYDRKPVGFGLLFVCTSLCEEFGHTSSPNINNDSNIYF